MIVKFIDSVLDGIDFKNPVNILVSFGLLILAIPLLCAVSFWLFVWSVKTLFGFEIPFDFIHWVAFIVLLSFLKQGSSNN